MRYALLEQEQYGAAMTSLARLRAPDRRIL